MAFPSVKRTGKAVPTGPTGILASGKRGAKKLGGRGPSSKRGMSAGTRGAMKGRR